MTFKVGDVCVILDTAYPPEVRGLECTITGPEDWYHVHGKPKFTYRVSIQGYESSDLSTAERDCLRLKRPPEEYDGNRSGDWDLIPWRPSKVYQ